MAIQNKNRRSILACTTVWPWYLFVDDGAGLWSEGTGHFRLWHQSRKNVIIGFSIFIRLFIKKTEVVPVLLQFISLKLTKNTNASWLEGLYCGIGFVSIKQKRSQRAGGERVGFFILLRDNTQAALKTFLSSFFEELWFFFFHPRHSAKLAF